MLVNPERLSKTAERVVEEFCWVQWDRHTQRLYYLTHNASHSQASISSHVHHSYSEDLRALKDTWQRQMCFRRTSLCWGAFSFTSARCVRWRWVPPPAPTSPVCLCYQHIISDRTVTWSQRLESVTLNYLFCSWSSLWSCLLIHSAPSGEAEWMQKYVLPSCRSVQ